MQATNIETRRDEIREQCAAYHAKHPEVWDYFVLFTFEKINQGYKNYSAMGIWQRLRWELDGGADGQSEFKINNNYVPYYSRRFMTMYPQHDGFFRTREPYSGKRRATGLPELRPADYG